MTPKQYEKRVALYFEEKGYKVELTNFTNDYCVDVFAQNDSEKIAIQAKMYGNSARKINRIMVMELHGAKDFFNCDRAMFATNGKVLQDAKKVADKLRIEINYLDFTDSNIENDNSELDFDQIWEKYIIALEGKKLYRENGDFNIIKKVDWGEIKRITSKGKTQHIEIEIFKQTINHILNYGCITRKYINEEYSKRASSGVVLILSQVPFIKLDLSKPMSLKLVK